MCFLELIKSELLRIKQYMSFSSYTEMQDIPRHGNKCRRSVKKDKQHVAKNKMKKTKIEPCAKVKVVNIVI